MTAIRSPIAKKSVYPALILEKIILFPGGRLSFVTQGREIVKTIDAASNRENLIVLLFRKNSEKIEAKSNIGVLARILGYWELSKNTVALTLDGERRVRLKGEQVQDDVRFAEVEEVETEEVKKDSTQIEALSRNALDQFKKGVQLQGTLPLGVIEDLQKDHLSPERVSDVLAQEIGFDFSQKLELLETLDVKKRLKSLNTLLAKEVTITQAENKIQRELEKEVNKAEREFFLRERLKAIENELGITEEQKEFDELEQKLKSSGIPGDAEKRVLDELHRLKRMPSQSPEVPYVRTYLEWVSELPWSKKDKTRVDLRRARKVLDDEHYGLEKVKDRILEYLAIQKLTKDKGRGGILSFIGPPGTGKTSVGRSIATALGRKFVRASLGGIRDEAEIRGHRRTYVGALPGRIIQGIRTAGTKNPIFMLDEIDKLGADFRGDPASALLEVLDPAQNSSFADHFIEIPFDLSDVLFITTGNILDPVPPALRDRMEVIEFSGYTEQEKLHIARKFLLPRVLSSSGLTNKQLNITDDAIQEIISRYTREAGVRDLERKLSEIVRKVAKKVAVSSTKTTTRVSASKVSNYLGPEEFEITLAAEEDEVGVATGLAWTEAGGDILFIEVSITAGTGNLTLTGQLGEVMKESARAALSYVRSRASLLNFDPDFYSKSDIHIHVPAGAIPKDGPSAGIAIAVALASKLSQRKVRKDVALTGEIRLTGKVLAIGGIKAKVLAAHRAGVKTVIMPKENQKKLIDIPKEVKDEITFKFVTHMDEVLGIALKT